MSNISKILLAWVLLSFIIGPALGMFIARGAKYKSKQENQ